MTIRLDTYMSGFLLIAGSAVVATLGMLLVRRKIDSKTLVACHEVGGYLLSVIGTLYAVLLGLVVVHAMNIFQEAHDSTELESNALADVALLAHRLPQGPREQILLLTETYTNLVVNEEWPEMDRGRHLQKARRAVLALIDEVLRFEPQTEAQTTIHEAQVAAALQVWNSRRTRTNLCARGIPSLLWLSLILGGIITTVFTFFFVLENLRLQVVMTSLIAITITLNIYLVGMFGHPYSGDLRVDPSSFDVIKEIADSALSAHPGPPARSVERRGVPGEKSHREMPVYSTVRYQKFTPRSRRSARKMSTSRPTS
jgi:hypothetical protein